MKRSLQEVVELVVFGLIALLIGTGVLWLAGWVLSLGGIVLKAIAGLLWLLLRFVVPVAIVAGLVYFLVKMLQDRGESRSEPAASSPAASSSAASSTTPAPPTSSDVTSTTTEEAAATDAPPSGDEAAENTESSRKPADDSADEQQARDPNEPDAESDEKRNG